MKNVRIILDNGVEENVNGIFYVFNSKYYFMYTSLESVDNDYIRLYIVQVCKEIQNTPTGPLDTGYMLGMEILDSEEWQKVQYSITKIVEDKKNGTQNQEIQYLPIDMLLNLKIVSKNKFKLMRHIIEDDFKVEVSALNNVDVQPIDPLNLTNSNEIVSPIQPVDSNVEAIQSSTEENIGDVIIDYRTRFFEEQEKNEILQEEIKKLKDILENVKNIIDNS